MRNIVSIGGGTGLSVLLGGLKKYFNVSAIVTVGDNGGGSGILREDLNMLPPGDIRNCLLALSEAPDDLRRLLGYRFTKGELAGQSLGNLIIAGMSEEQGSFESAITFLSRVFMLKGKVIPVSNSPMDLVAKLSNGDEIHGESEIAVHSLKRKARIVELSLENDCRLSYDAKRAIEAAELITLGPGSLYTSVICNLLVDELKDILHDKRIVYIANVMTQPEETYNYSLTDHVDEVEGYLGREVDYILANTEAPSREVLDKYKFEGSVNVVPTEEEKNKFGSRLIVGDFLEERSGYIRSDSLKIAEAISEII